MRGRLPSSEKAGDIFPSISMGLMQFEKQRFLFIIPWLFVDCRVEVIVPAFPALFARPLGDGIGLLQFFCNLSPIIKSKHANQFTNSLIFLNKR